LQGESLLIRPLAAGFAYAILAFAVAARLVMGLAAFLVLMLAEATLSVVFFGRSVTGYLASLGSLPGAIGLAAQVAFAGFPLAQARLA
jgi:hypothetical protein